MQAIRVFIIAPKYSTDALAFFAEAQNDALTSHVLASCGAWRSSLQSLRSCIENMFGAIYFNDHPTEFKLWERGRFRLGFTFAHKYFCEHPDLANTTSGINGLDAIKEEYATLSKAVHASAKGFRMSDEGAKLLLWSSDKAKLGAWSTRHKKVLEALTLLNVCLHYPNMQGGANPQLRSILGYAISQQNRNQLKSDLHVHIETPN